MKRKSFAPQPNKTTSSKRTRERYNHNNPHHPHFFISKEPVFMCWPNVAVTRRPGHSHNETTGAKKKKKKEKKIKTKIKAAETRNGLIFISEAVSDPPRSHSHYVVRHALFFRASCNLPGGLQRLTMGHCSSDAQFLYTR